MTAPPSSAQVPVLETLAFVRARVPAGAALLEVGCGDGRLAHELSREGYRVTAVDADAERVELARALGVDAHVAEFPDFDPGPRDAVLFTRSLHHVQALDEALAAAHELLPADGHLVVDDWSWSSVDLPTALWVRGTLDVLRRAGLVVAEGWTFEGDALASWRADREHRGIHDEARMLDAAGKRFELETLERVPYFYRYLAAELADREEGFATTTGFLDLEKNLIAARAIVPVGLRFVGRPRG